MNARRLFLLLTMLYVNVMFKVEIEIKVDDISTISLNRSEENDREEIGGVVA